MRYGGTLQSSTGLDALGGSFAAMEDSFSPLREYDCLLCGLPGDSTAGLRSNLGLYQRRNRGQTAANQGFDAGPDARIAFNSSMAFEKSPIIPGKITARGGLACVIEPKIAENLSMSGVGGCYPGTPMQYAAGLIEVNCLGHIPRYHRVVPSIFYDAVHLDCE